MNYGDPLAAFGISLPGPGSVAGCGDNDPLTPAADADLQAKYQKLRQRALLNMAPQLAMGIAPTTNPVLAATAFTATQTPSVPLRLTRLVFPNSTAPFFTLSSIKVGICDVIVAGSPSAEAFMDNQTTPPFEFGVAMQGTPVTVVGNNIDTAAAHRADITVFGINLQGEWGSLCAGC